jgi:hypothetical protein
MALTRKKKIIIGSAALLCVGVVGFIVIKGVLASGSASAPGGGNSSSVPAKGGIITQTVYPNGTLISNGSGKEVYQIQNGQKVYISSFPTGKSRADVIPLSADAFNSIPGSRLSGGYSLMREK